MSVVYSPVSPRLFPLTRSYPIRQVVFDRTITRQSHGEELATLAFGEMFMMRVGAQSSCSSLKIERFHNLWQGVQRSWCLRLFQASLPGPCYAPSCCSTCKYRRDADFRIDRTQALLEMWRGTMTSVAIQCP